MRFTLSFYGLYLFGFCVYYVFGVQGWGIVVGGIGLGGFSFSLNQFVVAIAEIVKEVNKE